MKLLKNNKQVGGMQAFILGIVSVAVVLAVGLIVLSELQTAAQVGGVSTGATTTASNATGSIITKLATVPTWVGIIIVVALAFIVLGYFYTQRN